VGSLRSTQAPGPQPFLACHRCDWQGDLLNLYSCPACGASLLVTYVGIGDLPQGAVEEGMWRYQRYLPVSTDVEPVTLGEGGTALLGVPRLDPTIRLATIRREDVRWAMSRIEDWTLVASVRHISHTRLTSSLQGLGA
jgi:hypothetical protein